MDAAVTDCVSVLSWHFPRVWAPCEHFLQRHAGLGWLFSVSVNGVFTVYVWSTDGPANCPECSPPWPMTAPGGSNSTHDPCEDRMVVYWWCPWFQDHGQRQGQAAAEHCPPLLSSFSFVFIYTCLWADALRVDSDRSLPLLRLVWW